MCMHLVKRVNISTIRFNLVILFFFFFVTYLQLLITNMRVKKEVKSQFAFCNIDIERTTS